MRLQGKDVTIKSGQYAGLRGTVIEHRQATNMAKINLEGVIDGKPQKLEVWLKVSQVEGA